MSDLDRITHYAMALHAAIGRQKLEIDGLTFTRVEGTHEHDPVTTGTHAQLYELAGTGKRYRVAVTPIPETHS